MDRIRSPARAVLLTVLIAPACSGSNIIFLEPPPPGQAATVIVAIHTSSALWVSAHAIDDRAISTEPIPDADEIDQIELVLHAGGLAALDLTEGSLNQPTGDQIEVALPGRHIEVYVSEVDGRDAGPWSRREDKSPELATFRFGANNPCRSFSADHQTIDASVFEDPTKADVEFAIPLASGAVMLGTNALARSSILRSEPGQLSRLEGCSDILAISGHAIGGNRFWLGGKSGALVQARIDDAEASCSIETSTVAPPDPGPAPTRVTKIAGSPPGEAFELYILTGLGRVWRFDGSSWELLLELSLHESDQRTYTQSGGLIWLGPRHILVSTGANEIRQWRAGQVSPAERLDVLGPDERIRTVTRLADERIFAGVAGGRVFERRDEIWEVVMAFPDDPFVLQAYERGWLALLTRGRVSQYDERFGLICEPTEIVGGTLRPRSMLVTERGVILPSLITADSDRGRFGEVIWLR